MEPKPSIKVSLRTYGLSSPCRACRAYAESYLVEFINAVTGGGQGLVKLWRGWRGLTPVLAVFIGLNLQEG